MCCCVKWIIGCGLRLVLIIINLPILLMGLGLLATGIVMSSMGDLVTPSEEAMVAGVAFLIVVGSILTVIGFSGVCGAFCNTDLLIKIYALIQILTFLLSLCMLIAVPIISNDMYERWHYEIEYLYELDGYEAVTERWNSLQSTAHCCGVDSYKDYATSNYTKSTGRPVPISCCNYDDSDPEADIQTCFIEAYNGTQVPNGTSTLHKTGCYTIVNTFESVLIGFLSSTLGLLIINGIIAFCLLKMNKPSD